MELRHAAPVDKRVGHLRVGVVVCGTGDDHVVCIRLQAGGEGGLFIDDFIGDVVRLEIIFVLVGAEVAPDDEVGVTVELLSDTDGEELVGCTVDAFVAVVEEEGERDDSE